MHPNERGRDKATGIKNDRFSVNPKSSLWLTSLLCKLSFCYSKCLPVPQAATCSIAGLSSCQDVDYITYQTGTENGKSVFQSQAACLLCYSCMRWFYFTFGSLSIIYLQYILQNGSAIWGDHRWGSGRLLLLKILFYLLILPIFLVWLVVRFPSCTSQKKTAKFCNLIYYCFIC